MSGDIVRFPGGGGVEGRRRNDYRKAVNISTRVVYDEVRLTALKSDGAMALAAHIMQEATYLDRVRRELAEDDPVTANMLAQFEATAFEQAKRLQRGLYSGFDL